MSRNSVVRATVDKDVKEQAMSIRAIMGLTMSDAVRILFARIVTERQLPFVPLEPNSETLAAMQELENDDLKSFDTVEELFRRFEFVDLSVPQNSNETINKSAKEVDSLMMIKTKSKRL